MQDPLAYCEALVREADKDRFLATLFAPAEHRGALFALYAFNVEVARVSEVVREPLAGEVRLQWWREALAGQRPEDVCGHPIASALIDVVTRYGLPMRLFDELIEARRFDLDHQAMQTFADVEVYARQTSSTLMELAGRILDRNTTSDALAFARPAGLSFALTGLLRAFGLHAARGRIYLPVEMLADFGVSPMDITSGRSSDALCRALARARGLAASHIEAARPLIAEAAPAFTAAWLPAALVPLYLRALERRRAQPFRTVDVPQWRRQWALWRAARAGQIGAP